MKKTALFSLLTVSALLLATPLVNNTTSLSNPIKIAEGAVTI
ncbi:MULTISPECIES: hypothetical protein [Bacillales]|nr:MULTISPECIES: hypothetical protein [Bacillus subtilis group]MEC1274835.1 hypothetical protein [Bacillus subtilis]MEC1318355.1 hypothetical protein [Bacillus subtilis]MEC1495550.1 hypothetical protein [Bacillus subtilis]